MAFRGKGQFRIIQKKIRLLKKHGIKIRVNVVVNMNNINQLTEIYQLCSELNVDRIAFNSLYPFKKESVVDIPETEICIKEFNRMLALSSLDNKVIIEQDPICIPHTEEYFKEIFIEDHRNIPELNCRAGIFSFEVNPVGNVYPCTFLHNKNFLVGNVKDESLEEMWKDDSRWTTIMNKISDLNSTCLDCSFSNKCKGGCIAAGFDSYGEIGAGDPRCKKMQNSVG